MSFSQAVSSGFKNYTNFKGRARRSEFWYFILFSNLIGLVLYVFDFILTPDSMFVSIIHALVLLAILLPYYAVFWRRLHDIGKSGACFLFVLIPVVGAIILIVWFAKDGDKGENKYGPDPKAAPEIGPEV